MKKFFYLFTIMVATFMSVSYVKADVGTTYNVLERDFIPLTNIYGDSCDAGEFTCTFWNKDTYLYTNFTEFYKNSKNKEIFDNLYDEVMEVYSVIRNDYPYYKLSVWITSSSADNFKLYAVGLRLRIYDTSSADNQLVTINNAYKLGTYYSVYINNIRNQPGNPTIYDIYQNTDYQNCRPGLYGYDSGECNTANKYYIPINSIPFRTDHGLSFYLPFQTFETNTHHVITNSADEWNIYDSNGILLNSYSAGDEYPSLYSTGEFSNSDNLTTVNLNSYAYVILSLKDYSQKNAFSTKMKVKGSIGITPVYDFGTLEKSTQITDRCNASYDDFTSYYLYVTEPDLSNHVVYYIKACEENSSFKYDSSVFNVHTFNSESEFTTLTIDGNNYSTIPFNQLSSTANLNEENNYIPGASENVVTGNSVGLTAILKNVQSKLNEIWSIFTYFMSFVNQIFSVLPDEIRTVLVASFTIGCVLGLIKILKA